MGVAWTGSEDSYQAFVDEHGLTFPQISDTSADVFSRFGVASQPAFVIVRPDGTTEQMFGAIDESLLDQILSEI